MKTLTFSDLRSNYGLSFSGTRYLTSVSKHAMEQAFILNLNWYIEFDRFSFGSTIGVDTIAGELIKAHHPTAELIVYVPAKRDKVDWSFENWADGVFYMPPNTDYKDRNQMLVNVSTALSAYPNQDEELDERSGTWQCVRQARVKKPRPDILVNPLSGKEKVTIWEPGSQ